MPLSDSSFLHMVYNNTYNGTSATHARTFPNKISARGVVARSRININLQMRYNLVMNAEHSENCLSRRHIVRSPQPCSGPADTVLPFQTYVMLRYVGSPAVQNAWKSVYTMHM